MTGGGHRKPSDEENETANPACDAESFAAYRWTIYAERLGALSQAAARRLQLLG